MDATVRRSPFDKPWSSMSHRSPAVVIGAAAALLITAASASAAAPMAKLATANQSDLVAGRKGHALVSAPAHTLASIRLVGADGHRLSAVRKVAFRHARTARVSLELTHAGLGRLDDCRPRKLDLRVTLRHGKDVTTLHDRRALKLDAKRCAAAPALKP